jgi:aminoglycoside phosphotransferase (APT) family kinase protein
VAEPLWYDEGQAFAQGRPLMVRRLVEGSSTVPGLTEQTPDGEALRRRIVEEHVEKLATVHRLDWSAMGLDQFIPAPPSAAEALRFEYDAWRRLWEERRTEPFPLITEFLCWLGEQIPDDTPRVSLVKGNNGIGEEIFRDGALVAMSDWELASLGDGALDLAFSQGTLGLVGFSTALKLYEQHMGAKVSPERLAFAMLWIRFKGVACINGYALRNLQAGGDLRTTAAALGYVSVSARQDQMASCLGKDLVTALGDLQPDARAYLTLED